MKNIAQVLKKERENKGLTLNSVAKEVGMSASYLYRIEEGERKKPSIKFLRSLAEFYNIDFYYLIDLTV
ncbi:helix-turn-helix domain-containing protein [Clostridium perfringens]|nr:helix-turn-helix transcriptional regulator [Clostridium perfringens]HAT4071944.1 helix-turn-helix transcriptional regulator [Clostridium perfringens]